MERRLLLAIVLMIGVVILTNLLFPPVPPPREEPAGADTTVRPAAESAELPPAEPAAAEATGEPAEAREPEPEAAPGDEPAAEPAGGAGQEERPEVGEAARAFAGPAPGEADVEEGDTIVVRSGLYEHRFSTRGARLLDARLVTYASYAPEADPGSRVSLVRPGDALLGFRIAAGEDTLDLRDRTFEPSARELVVPERPEEEVGHASGAPTDSLVFTHVLPVGQRELRFEVVYRFRPDSYLVDVEGRFAGLAGRGYSVLTSLGRGLRSNEANPDEDMGQLEYVVREADRDIASGKLDDAAPGQRLAVPGGPFGWVAVKNKYYLAAFVAPPESSGFGGFLVTGREEEHSGDMEAALPVPAGAERFTFGAFLGPQDFGRLSHVGQDLQNVNPYGWRWLRPVIRPLVGIIMVVLVWMHETFELAYGWVLIVFGVLMRIVLFPLYQKSMRAQMAQMQVQPLVKDLQAKYKDEPQKMQQEMMRLYREHNINPLAGCLPMLLPFPVLITLFFVFQNTIEFRGVPFMWLPDLSLKDPLYIIPLLMGLSMFLLSWIGQRGMESNTQMKIMGYAMPVVFTFLFMNFPSGLNLYYATSNFASLPQQLYLSRERRKARATVPSPESDAGG